jgi:hypothetical protein
MALMGIERLLDCCDILHEAKTTNIFFPTTLFYQRGRLCCIRPTGEFSALRDSKAKFYANITRFIQYEL